MSVSTRLVTSDDAPAIAELCLLNRDFLAPWEPEREEAFYTAEAQLALIEKVLEQHGRGESLPHLIVEDGRIVGRITLSGIVRGPFLSANLGYWVSSACNGRGVASAAAGLMVRLAFDQEGLHRLQAGTLVHNVRSQKVLERNGFVRYGLAPRYLNIAGQWQDHILYQRLNE